MRRRRRSPYLPRAIRNDPHEFEAVRQTDHPAVGIKRQLKPSSSLLHRPAKIETEQLEITCTTSGRPWTVEQDIQDRSADREDMPRDTTTATYSDVTNLTTPEPNAADGITTVDVII